MGRSREPLWRNEEQLPFKSGKLAATMRVAPVPSPSSDAVIKRTNQLCAKLSQKFPTFLIYTRPEQLSGSSFVRIPADFRRHMPKRSAEISLKDGRGNTTKISYLARSNAFDGSDWKGFLKAQKVSEGDGLVLPLAMGQTFQVYVVRKDGSDDFDGALSSEDDDDGKDTTDNSSDEGKEDEEKEDEDEEDEDLRSVSTSSGENSSGHGEDDSDVEIVGSEVPRDVPEQTGHPEIHSNTNDDSSSPLKTSSEPSEGEDTTDNSSDEGKEDEEKEDEDEEDEELCSVSTSSGENSSGHAEDDSDVEIVGSEVPRDGPEQTGHPQIHSNTNDDSSSPLKTSSEPSEVPIGGFDQICNPLMDTGANVDKDERSPSSPLRTSSKPNNDLHARDESHGCSDDRGVPKRIRFSESNVEFKEVKAFENFVIVVNDMVIDSVFSEDIRRKYYDLCCSQNSFLHESIVVGINYTLVEGLIIETVKIADAIRVCSSSTSGNKFVTLDKSLEALEKWGMNVRFIRERMNRLWKLADESKRLRTASLTKKSSNGNLALNKDLAQREVEFLSVASAHW